jgi:putative oxidoreductase
MRKQEKGSIMKRSYQQISGQLSQASDLALLLLRLVLGWLMILHGLMKFQEKGGDKAFQGLLTFLHNVPFPAFTGAVLPWAELALGALLILGALTRVTALLLALEMLTIAFLVKLHDAHVGVISASGAPLPGAELEFALTAGLLALLLMGPGRASADHALGLERRGVATAAPKPSSPLPAQHEA